MEIQHNLSKLQLQFCLKGTDSVNLLFQYFMQFWYFFASLKDILTFWWRPHFSIVCTQDMTSNFMLHSCDHLGFSFQFWSLYLHKICQFTCLNQIRSQLSHQLSAQINICKPFFGNLTIFSSNAVAWICLLIILCFQCAAHNLKSLFMQTFFSYFFPRHHHLIYNLDFKSFCSNDKSFSLVKNFSIVQIKKTL